LINSIEFIEKQFELINFVHNDNDQLCKTHLIFLLNG